MTQQAKSQSRLKAVGRALVKLGALYILVCVVLYVAQRRLLFFPSHERPSGRLSVWLEEGRPVGFCREVSNPTAVWLMTHGNAGQASDRDYVLDRLRPSDALYVLEYPGYGDRPGSPSRESFDRAALEAYNQLSDRYPETPLCVLGESIGSGPACRLSTAQRRPDKVVLIVPFDTLHNVASERFAFLPVWLLLADRWDNIEALQSYAGPVDIFGARDDVVIPFKHAKKLAECSANVRLHELPCGHNDWSYSNAVSIAFDPKIDLPEGR